MQESARGLRALVALAMLLCIVASLTGAGAGQDKSTGGMKVANVDPERLLLEYASFNTARTELEKKVNEKKIYLSTVQRHPFLTEAEQKSLSDLMLQEGAPNGLNDQQKAAKKKLMDQSKALYDESQALQSKPVGQVNQQDQIRINALNKLYTDANIRFDNGKKEADDEIDKTASTAQAKANKEIRDAITKIAKEKGINVVFNSQVAYYAETDLTEDVLKFLNKK